MYRFFSTFFAINFILHSIPFSAIAGKVTIKDLYNIALTNNSNVKAAIANETAYSERLKTTKSEKLPKVTISSERMANYLTNTSSRDYYYSDNTTLNIRQPLLRPGLLTRIEQDTILYEDAINQRKNVEYELLTQLTSAAFENLLAIYEMEYSHTALRSANNQLDVAKKSFQSGSGVITDIHEAKARLDLATAQNLHAKLQVDITHRKLERITTQSSGELFNLLEDDQWERETYLPELTGMLDMIDDHPQMRSLNARVKSAQLEIEKSKALHLPTLDTVARWTQSNSENVFNPTGGYKNYQLGLQLTIPIFEGGATQSKVREAAARLDEAEQRLLTLKRELSQQLEDQYRVVQEGRTRITALRQALKSAQQSLISNTKSFAAGYRTRSDVILAEQALAQAKRDLLKERIIYLQAQLSVRLLTGRTPEEAIESVLFWFDQ